MLCGIYPFDMPLLQIIFVNEPNGRNFVTKADYAEKGPKAILGQSASLL